MISRPLKISLLIGASLAVASCSVFDPWAGGQKIDSSEDLLAAEGTWHLVEEKRLPSSPVQLNQDARHMVNPDQMQNSDYTTKEPPQMMASGQDIHYRLLKMEREVQSLRRDFNKLLPPLKNLLISDAQLKRAISDVENAQGVYAPQMAAAMKQHMAKPVMNKPVAKKSKPSMKKDMPTGSGVWRVRIGDHPGKTRIVLDLAGASAYSYDIDNAEKLLLIDLPGTKWSAAASKTWRKHPLIAGYSASDNGNGGTMLAIQLKKSTNILKSVPLAPNNVHGHRIMFDLSK
jgi:hypothetical protein